MTDAELLEAYSSRQDEQAFGEMMKRHGALVYRACFRLLKDAREAEDASQAVFVVLARKAGRLRKGDLASWLYRVAHYVAAETVRKRMHRTKREEAYAEDTAIQPGESALEEVAGSAVVMESVDAALLSLPERYRQAVILRYLQNHSEKDAARLVGCPLGTLSRRASQGIAMLRQRLAKRGVALSGVALGGLLASEASAAVSETLLPSILATVQGTAATAAAGTAATSTATMLAEGAMKAMFIAKVKTAAVIAAVAVMVTGTAVPVGIAVAQAAKKEAGSSVLDVKGGWDERTNRADFAAGQPSGEDAAPAKVQTAIENGLSWLATNQIREGADAGSWPVGAANYRTAVASLAGLAFLANGHLPGTNAYGAVLQRSLDYVKPSMAADGYLGMNDRSGMYIHAINLLFGLSVLGMLEKPDQEAELAAWCKRGSQVIFNAQQVKKNAIDRGGWRYDPYTAESDASVTGWQLLALHSARQAGFEIGKPAYDTALAYLNRAYVPAKAQKEADLPIGGYLYRPGFAQQPERSVTALVLLVQSLFDVSDERRTQAALAFLRRDPPTWGGHQYNGYFYFCGFEMMQGMFRVGGKEWDSYGSRMATLLLDHQAADGSWPYPPDNAMPESLKGTGPAYPVAMAVLMLSVEKQLLPMSQRLHTSTSGSRRVQEQPAAAATPESVYGRGFAYWKEEDWQRCATTLEPFLTDPAMRTSPLRAEALFMLARSYNRKSLYPQAINVLQTILKDHEDFKAIEEVYTEHARLAIEVSEWAAAAETCKRFAAKFPNSERKPYLELYAAAAQIGSGNADAGAASLRELTTADTFEDVKADAYYRLAMMSLRQPQPDKAAAFDLLRKSVACYAYAKSLLLAATCACDLNDWPAASAYLDRFTREFPKADRVQLDAADQLRRRIAQESAKKAVGGGAAN